MLGKIEKFDSGWVGISLELTASDIDKLIHRLGDLLNRRIGHFHLRTDDFSMDVGVADIELSLAADESSSNMSVE